MLASRIHSAAGASASRKRFCAQPKGAVARSVVMASTAPKTGHHTVADDLRKEALSFFFEDNGCVCKPTTGGVNNVVNYVESSNGERYVLRIYNNGNLTAKVAGEHEILGQLAKQTLSIKTPKVKPSLRDGKPFVLLSNGAAACVFEIIPGTLAKTTSPEEVGRATGELCTAMGKIDVSRIKVDDLTPPYARVFEAHHAMNRDKFYKEVATNPEFNDCREVIDYLVAQIRDIEPRLEAYSKMGLPTQVIHADLHYDNVMVQGDSVSGVLDFEFCTYDWRAMELAVALSKYVGEEDPQTLIERFASGYLQTGQLSDAEIEIVPDLINLRIFSNVVYFTGRAVAGEDGLFSLTSRAPAYAKRVRWVNANREAIVKGIKSKALAAARA